MLDATRAQYNDTDGVGRVPVRVTEELRLDSEIDDEFEGAPLQLAANSVRERELDWDVDDDAISAEMERVAGGAERESDTAAEIE